MSHSFLSSHHGLEIVVPVHAYLQHASLGSFMENYRICLMELFIDSVLQRPCSPLHGENLLLLKQRRVLGLFFSCRKDVLRYS